MSILSLTNSSEYNNKLEKILEKKSYSEETKNLLLSMLYKIENSLNDYKIVKRNFNKEKFILKLLYVIEKECNSIEVYTKKDYNEKVNTIVDEEEGKIVVNANEEDLLYALSLMHIKFIIMQQQSCLYHNKEDEILSNSLKKFLIEVIPSNDLEILRDFNGWTWSTVINEIGNIGLNIIYQNMLILLDEEIILEYLNLTEKDNVFYNLRANKEDLSVLNNSQNSIKEDFNYFNNEILERLFSKDFTLTSCEEYVDYIKTIIIVNELSKDNNEKTIIEEQLSSKKELINLMKDNKAFINYATDIKKKDSKEIEKIDIILNDKKIILEEYNKRNSKLPDKEKIFSVSHLSNMLEEERKALLEEIRKLNGIIEPKKFIKYKEEENKEYKKLQKLSIGLDDAKYRDLLIESQREFLKLFKIKINATEDRDSLIKLVYDLRYYLLLPIDVENRIYNVLELQSDICDTVNLLIDKCIDKKIFTNFSNSVSLCYNILKYIFITQTIKLENINIEIKKENEVLIDEKDKTKEYHIIINIYDEKEKTEEHKCVVENLSLLNVKLGKKTTLFI